jgi:hypothetical protein
MIDSLSRSPAIVPWSAKAQPVQWADVSQLSHGLAGQDGTIKAAALGIVSWVKGPGVWVDAALSQDGLM